MNEQPKRRRQRYVLSDADVRIMRVVLRYHCVTAMQVTKLLYEHTSLHWVQTKLKELWGAGYLERDRVPHRLSQGSPPLYYALSRDGMKQLAARGVAIPARARPYRIHEFSYLHISHLLAVNEVLLAAELLCRHDERFALARPPLHDKDLRRSPVPVTDTVGSRRKVVLDGFLDFEVHTGTEPYRFPVCLEIDRGTENQAAFRIKIRTLLLFADGPYQDAFGRQSLTIAVITTSRDRLRTLKAWIEAELHAQQASDEDADMFLLGSFAIDWNVPEKQRPSPAELFLAARWYAPFADRPVALLEPNEPGALRVAPPIA